MDLSAFCQLTLHISVLEHMASDHNLPLLLGSKAPWALRTGGGAGGAGPRLQSRWSSPKPDGKLTTIPSITCSLKLPFLSRTWLKKEQFIYKRQRTGLHYSTLSLKMFYYILCTKYDLRITLEENAHGEIYLLLEILYYIFPKRYKIFQEKISKPIDSKVSNIIKMKAKILFQTKECENISAQVQQRHGKVITMFYNTLYSILF